MTQPGLPPALNRLLVAAFVLAIAVPLVGTMSGVNGEATAEENRAAAPWPALPHDLASLTAWPDAFTGSYADRFAFRAVLVRMQARLRVEWLRSSPTQDVLIGRESWLFYGTDGAVEDYAGVRPFSEAELDAWCATLQHTQDWLERQGIGYVFLIAPDKHWVYLEHMPRRLNRYEGRSRVDQLIERLRACSTVRVIDVREPLREARQSGRVYHRTDTHWNDPGAFVAYREVMARIATPLGLQPRARGDFEQLAVPRTGLDLARMIGLGTVMVEEDVQLEPRGGRLARVVEPADAQGGLMYPRVVTEGPPGGPRALVFRDSFGSAMIPFLSEHFSRAVYVWQNHMDPAIVASERPAVVIQEWVSRHLYTATPYDAVAALGARGQQ